MLLWYNIDKMKEGMIYMFKVKITCKSKRKVLVSQDSFETKDKAEMAVCDHIEKQLKDCYKTWGLCDYDVQEKNNGYTYEVSYKPCLSLLKPLVLQYDIVERSENNA